MTRKVLVLCMSLLMIFSFTVQGYASTYAPKTPLLKNVKVEVKQTKEGLVEEGSVEIDGKEISFKKVDKTDGTIEISTIEDGKNHKIKIDKSKGIMDFDGETIELEEFASTTSTSDSYTIASDTWVFQSSWKGSTVVDGLINASVTFVASCIIGSLPGAVYMSMQIALGLASIWQAGYATMDVLYYTIWKYRDFNPPSPYPYRDKYLVSYYKNSARTDFAFSDQWIEYPLLP
ncbi:MAG: hypothetical protein K0R93_3451 [Anaerosolibacter sp.]|jgi:hypothetical protein|uniref:hypothetical protein n=1 Tax=Anaerosolibacter sp. TaxID=1872527 RepID=UPI002629761F|nr:hypothetical protein [Anaerosolibacter sp.]MDF2548553.1 hypothetical protein [Anaerosolibacter sp.]